jgi:hypothetical protein
LGKSLQLPPLLVLGCLLHARVSDLLCVSDVYSTDHILNLHIEMGLDPEIEWQLRVGNLVVLRFDESVVSAKSSLRVPVLVAEGRLIRGSATTAAIQVAEEALLQLGHPAPAGVQQASTQVELGDLDQANDNDRSSSSHSETGDSKGEREDDDRGGRSSHSDSETGDSERQREDGDERSSHSISETQGSKRQREEDDDGQEQNTTKSARLNESDDRAATEEKSGEPSAATNKNKGRMSREVASLRY